MLLRFVQTPKPNRVVTPITLRASVSQGTAVTTPPVTPSVKEPPPLPEANIVSLEPDCCPVRGLKEYGFNPTVLPIVVGKLPA